MKYYVTTDTHSYFKELYMALTEKGFFEDEDPHKLIICGDIFDRGKEALQLQEFILDLISKDEVILIRGNHDDLAMDLLNGWKQKSYLEYHHHTNGTIDTVCQLTGYSINDFKSKPEEIREAFLKTPYIQKIIPKMIDYFETSNYIYTHGWIPCTKIKVSPYKNEYILMKNWRNATLEDWRRARWVNGMEAAFLGGVVQNKTIVCGHWHCSFGHAHHENDGGEFDNNPNFLPYYGEGIIALDACTAFSHKVNCIVINDD